MKKYIMETSNESFAGLAYLKFVELVLRSWIASYSLKNLRNRNVILVILLKTLD